MQQHHITPSASSASLTVPMNSRMQEIDFKETQALIKGKSKTFARAFFARALGQLQAGLAWGFWLPTKILQPPLTSEASIARTFWGPRWRSGYAYYKDAAPQRSRGRGRPAQAPGASWSSRKIAAHGVCALCRLRREPAPQPPACRPGLGASCCHAQCRRTLFLRARRQQQSSRASQGVRTTPVLTQAV